MDRQLHPMPDPVIDHAEEVAGGVRHEQEPALRVQPIPKEGRTAKAIIALAGSAANKDQNCRARRREAIGIARDDTNSTGIEPCGGIQAVSPDGGRRDEHDHQRRGPVTDDETRVSPPESLSLHTDSAAHRRRFRELLSVLFSGTGTGARDPQKRRGFIRHWDSTVIRHSSLAALGRRSVPLHGISSGLTRAMNLTELAVSTPSSSATGR